MAHLYRFGPFQLDSRFGALLRMAPGKPQPLHVAPQPFRALEYLVEHAGDLVSREELGGVIWDREVFVDQNLGLNHCIRRVRSVLGDSARRPKFIQTVPRRGYRFIADVEVLPKAASPAEEDKGGRCTNEQHRIAVLPFSDFSPTLVEARFGDGLADEVMREAFRVASPERQILALQRPALGQWQATQPADPPDWVLSGSARYETGRLHVLGYLTQAVDGAVLRTTEWHDDADHLGLDVQRRAAEALVADLLASRLDAAVIGKAVGGYERATLRINGMSAPRGSAR